VNAANEHLLQGGGVCGAIFRAAGSRELQAACDKLAPIETGASVITPGFALPAKYVIHTAGPRYRDGMHGEEALLRSSYQKSLALAVENGCQSIAFPLISSGIFGYPKKEALRVATESIRDFLLANEAEPLVYLVIFEPIQAPIAAALRGEIEGLLYDAPGPAEADLEFSERFDLLHENEDPRPMEISRASAKTKNRAITESYKTHPGTLADNESSVMKKIGAMIHGAIALNVALEKPFSTILMQLIAAKGLTDVEVYKRANIDRKLFSKIRNPNYTPSKKTVLALIVALKLTPDEADDLMKRAGFAFSGSILLDVVVKNYISMRKYDIFEINNTLFAYDAPLLGVAE